MADVALLGRRFTVATYRLGELARVAPHIDRVNETVGTTASDFSAQIAATVAIEMASVLAVGLMKVDRSLTAEHLLDQLTTADLPEIHAAFMAVVADAGLTERKVTGSVATGGTHHPLDQQIERIIMLLVASGIEGGSLAGVERRWTLPRVYALQAHWREFGPPVHMGLAALAPAVGGKLTETPSASTSMRGPSEHDAEVEALLASVPMRQSAPIAPVDFAAMTPADREAHMRSILPGLLGPSAS